MKRTMIETGEEWTSGFEPRKMLELVKIANNNGEISMWGMDFRVDLTADKAKCIKCRLLSYGMRGACNLCNTLDNLAAKKGCPKRVRLKLLGGSSEYAQAYQAVGLKMKFQLKGEVYEFRPVDHYNMCYSCDFNPQSCFEHGICVDCCESEEPWILKKVKDGKY